MAAVVRGKWDLKRSVFAYILLCHSLCIWPHINCKKLLEGALTGHKGRFVLSRQGMIGSISRSLFLLTTAQHISKTCPMIRRKLGGEAS